MKIRQQSVARALQQVIGLTVGVVALLALAGQAGATQTTILADSFDELSPATIGNSGVNYGINPQVGSAAAVSFPTASPESMVPAIGADLGGTVGGHSLQIPTSGSGSGHTQIQDSPIASAKTPATVARMDTGIFSFDFETLGVKGGASRNVFYFILNNAAASAWLAFVNLDASDLTLHLTANGNNAASSSLNDGTPIASSST